VVVARGVEIGSPKVWGYMIGGEPQTWWRVPVTNHKDPVDLTVRVAAIEPEVPLIIPNGRLHRMGDDPPDRKYAGVTNLQHDETAWFDVITMSPRVPGHEAAVVSSSTSTFQVTMWTPFGDPRWPLPVEFCIRTVDRPDYRMPVELNGTYRITLSAHFGSKSLTRAYRLEAEPDQRVLGMFHSAKR
jgi:hypothetical protein